MDASDNAQSSLCVVQYASRLKRRMQVCMYTYYVHLFRYDSRMRKDVRLHVEARVKRHHLIIDISTLTEKVNYFI